MCAPIDTAWLLEENKRLNAENFHFQQFYFRLCAIEKDLTVEELRSILDDFARQLEKARQVKT